MCKVMFSVVVVCLNAEETILDTINSILRQSLHEYEIIVKDGCSKDKTLDLVPDDERIRVISKSDESIYDAMNQALQYVNGKYVIYMNCGDSFYSPYVLERIKSVIQKNNLSGEEIIYGNYSKKGMVYKQICQIDKKFILKSGLCHQTVFFGRKLFEKYGSFDTMFKICADYEIMARAFCRGVSYIYVDETICHYLGGGVSEQEKNLKLVKKEGNLVRKRYFTFADRCEYNFNRLKARLRRKGR